jgi:outer membrane receptor protein involved in Fe transport
VQATYAFGSRFARLRGTKITLGVENALNDFGPRSPSNPQANIDSSIYGAVGRKFYVGLQHKF